MAIASAFQRAGREGQATASNLLREESNRLRQPTDKEHFADALERTTLAVESGVINPENKEAISAFTQNQYLLNKTGGNRDLGGNFGRFGIMSQLGAGDGTEKYLLAGVNPYAQTKQGTIVYGAKGENKIGENLEGRPQYESIKSGTTSDEVLLDAGDEANLLKLRAESGAKQPKKASSLGSNKKVIKDINDIFSSKSDNFTQTFLQLQSTKKKILDLTTKIQNKDYDTNAERLSLDKQLQEAKTTEAELEAGNSDIVGSLEEKGWKLDDATGDLLFKNDLTDAMYDTGYYKSTRPIIMEHKYDPKTKKVSTTYITTKYDKNDDKDVEVRMTPDQASKWLDNLAGGSRKNLIKITNEGLTIDNKKLDKKKNELSSEVEGVLSNVLKNGYLSREDANKYYGKEGADILFEGAEKGLLKSKEKLSIAVLQNKINELNKISNKNVDDNILYNKMSLDRKSKFVRAIAKMNAQLSFMQDSNEAVRRGLTKKEFNTKTNSIQENINKLDDAIRSKVNDGVISLYALIDALGDKYGNNVKDKIRISNDMSSIIVNNGLKNTPIGIDKLQYKDVRDQVYRIIDQLNYKAGRLR